MSIITEAMRKAALQRGGSSTAAGQTSGGGQASSRRVRNRSPMATRASAPDAVMRFQSTTLDAAALRSNKVLTHLEDRPARRAYKILRTKVLQRLEANQWRSFAVTGPDTGAGKTLTAVNLALALAQDPNTWVFLVDLDLQRPKVGTTLGMSFSRGLTDYLLGDASLDDVVYHPEIERLAVVPNSRPVEQSSELLSSQRMHEFMTALEAESPRRVIVYDAPPLLVSDDVLTVAPQIDGVLIVTTQGVTPRGSLEQAREVLSDMNVLGVVLNRSSERDDSPYY
jgi:capsular exopolysaccharide synthesis family protein